MLIVSLCYRFVRFSTVFSVKVYVFFNPRSSQIRLVPWIRALVRYSSAIWPVSSPRASYLPRRYGWQFGRILAWGCHWRQWQQINLFLKPSFRSRSAHSYPVGVYRFLNCSNYLGLIWRGILLVPSGFILSIFYFVSRYDPFYCHPSVFIVSCTCLDNYIRQCLTRSRRSLIKHLQSKCVLTSRRHVAYFP